MPPVTRADPEVFDFMSVVFPLVGIGLIVLGFYLIGRAVLWVRRGRKTLATITKAEERLVTTGDGANITWIIDMEYLHPETGTVQAQWGGNSPLDQTRYVAGMQVEILYDPRNPRRVHLHGRGQLHPVFTGLIPLFIGAVFLALSRLLFGG